METPFLSKAQQLTIHGSGWESEECSQNIKKNPVIYIWKWMLCAAYSNIMILTTGIAQKLEISHNLEMQANFSAYTDLYSLKKKKKNMMHVSVNISVTYFQHMVVCLGQDFYPFFI